MEVDPRFAVVVEHIDGVGIGLEVVKAVGGEVKVVDHVHSPDYRVLTAADVEARSERRHGG